MCIRRVRERSEIYKKKYCTKLAILFNVGPCPQRLATAAYRRYRIVATGLAGRTRTCTRAGGTRIYRTKNERWWRRGAQAGRIAGRAARRTGCRDALLGRNCALWRVDSGLVGRFECWSETGFDLFRELSDEHCAVVAP